MLCVPDDEANRRAAVEALCEGRLVAYPTDTLYGLGANVFDARAVEAVFAAKGRGPQQSLPVLIEALADLERVATGVSPEALALADRFWPGPLTMVLRRDPALPATVAVIWVGGLTEIEALIGLEASDFAAALEERLKGLLGEVESVGARARFPVAGLTAKAITAPRVALAGEAAHILPPVGAQGLNLGLRDGAALADCVAAALERGEDPGGAPVLKAYADARRLDILTRTVGVDLLTRSLLTSLLPVQAARGLVLHGLNAIGPLRRFAMRAGMAPPNALPSLMRPAASG